MEPKPKRASVVSTKRGDDGTTGLLFGGERVFKDDLRTEAFGTVEGITDDALFEKLAGGENLTKEEVLPQLVKAIAIGCGVLAVQLSACAIAADAKPESQPKATAADAKPLFKNFMAINGHFTFKPTLYRQVCQVVRNYHNLNWDVKHPGDTINPPVCVSVAPSSVPASR